MSNPHESPLVQANKDFSAGRVHNNPYPPETHQHAHWQSVIAAMASMVERMNTPAIQYAGKIHEANQRNNSRI